MKQRKTRSTSFLLNAAEQAARPTSLISCTDWIQGELATGSEEKWFSSAYESVTTSPQLTAVCPSLDHKLFGLYFRRSGSHPSLVCGYISSKNLVIRVPARGYSENYSKSIKIFLVGSGPHAAKSSQHVLISFNGGWIQLGFSTY